MARVCACCQHPKCVELNAALLAESETLKDLAVAYGVSAFSLSRHKSRHLLVSPTDTSLTTEEEIRMWALRADEAYQMAGSNSEVRSMCAALAAGLRALEVSVRHRGEISQAEARELPHDQRVWTEDDRRKFQAYLDHILATTEIFSDFEKTGENHHEQLRYRN